MGNCNQVQQQDDAQNDPDSTTTTDVGANVDPDQIEAKSKVQDSDSNDDTSVQIEADNQKHDCDVNNVTDTSCKSYLKKAWNILGIYVFMFDQGTDIFASHQHFINGDVYWGCLTILFFLLPLILNCIKNTYKDIQDYVEKTKKTKNKPLVRHKCFLVMISICLAPIRAFYQIVDNVFNILNGNVDDDVIANIWFLKLLEALLESLPQASLQLFVILDENISENNITNVISDTYNTSNINSDIDFSAKDILDTLNIDFSAKNILDTLNEVEAWQWVTVATSIISLSFMVSANTYLLSPNTRNRSRLVYFFLGKITVLARLAVFTVYISIGRSLGMKSLWLIPVSTMLFGSIIVWLFKRFCLKEAQQQEDAQNDPDSTTTPDVGATVDKVQDRDWFKVLPLNEEVHHDWSFWGTVVMSWVLTAAYNSFTPSGLLISTSNFLLAMIAVHLDTNLIERAPFESAIILIPATFSFITNLILVIVPEFRFITEEWLNIGEDKKTKLY